ncbi:hypothetical protein B484DRAFT_454267 [Ochromonadaceae sp. CCMP2298]|nr:hypothetical protein B484DRAFT_454267 [Ochromonadaceae sp. CCMP2298]|mmetsp:Transcript_7417/g.16253  ORF Transcript_7417/g.16253 Transcript_7417/m.16253 type:complete len:746 (+) Transcript_7417:168-2405(+)
MSNTLKLERGDLLQMEPISNTGTLKLLPTGKKNKQKLIIGDDSGMLSCYEFKNGGAQIVFQTKVFDGPITCVALGGNSVKRDKIFVSHSQRIAGLTKKGKDFFKLTSSLTETIQNIAVEDTRIWTGCENIYNLCDNGVDSAFYISKDRINDLLVAKVTRDSDFDTVLACQDSCIRIIHGSTLFLEIPTDAAVTALGFMEIEADMSGVKGPTAVIYGLATGALGMAQIFSNGEFTHIWSVDDTARSPITCICIDDIDSDGCMEILLGRDDGRIDVFKQQAESIFAVPYKICTKDISESVRSIVCGIVSTVDFREVIVAAYSGKIISFTTEQVLARAPEDQYGRSYQTINNENRIKNLRDEIAALRKTYEADQKKNKKLTAAGAGGAIKPTPEFPVNAKFALDTVAAAYVLTVELQSSIDLIILRSPVELDLVETDTGTSVLSVTPPQMQAQFGGGGGEDAGKFVAVFRCQSQERRIVLTLRTNEGEFGALLVTVVADSQPKAAKIIKYDLKPLSLHTKVYELTPAEKLRPKNKMRYTGSMPLATIHEWVQAIFPEVPPRLDDGVTEQHYFFRNTFTGATCDVLFRKNEVIFECENASTIAIVKENVTRLANYRRILLEEFVTAEDASVASFLGLVQPKLEHQLSLSKKMALVDAVQEIAMTDASSTEWLSDEYKQILGAQETIRREFKSRDKSLEYLSGIITDLFVDWYRLQGVDAKQHLPRLQSSIMAGRMEEVVRSFHELQVRR